jgi:hypothetical protein
MKQTAWIIASVKSRWVANAALPSLVPGGLLAGFMPSPAARPFAMIVCNPEGAPEYTTGRLYVQAYSVSIGVWAGEKVGDAGQIQSALETLMSADTKLMLLTGNAWTLHISLQPGSIDPLIERMYGKFTFTASARWLVQLQELRF